VLDENVSTQVRACDKWIHTNGMEFTAGHVDSKRFHLRVVEVDRDEANASGIPLKQRLLRSTDETSTDVRSEDLLTQPPLYMYTPTEHPKPGPSSSSLERLLGFNSIFSTQIMAAISRF